MLAINSLWHSMFGAVSYCYMSMLMHVYVYIYDHRLTMSPFVIFLWRNIENSAMTNTFAIGDTSTVADCMIDLASVCVAIRQAMSAMFYRCMVHMCICVYVSVCVRIFPVGFLIDLNLILAPNGL